MKPHFDWEPAGEWIPPRESRDPWERLLIAFAIVFWLYFLPRTFVDYVLPLF